MQNIVNGVIGHVRVELVSDFPERFINICARNGFPIWDVERVDSVTLRVSLRRDNFKKLLPFAARGVGSVKIIKKSGLPFFLWRFRKRYALLAGFILTLCGLVILSQFIWEIDVQGNAEIPTELILRELDSLGVGVGTYTGGVNSSELQHLMILRIPELEWLAVNTSGSRALVEVRERTPKPEIVPQDVPCNVVAEKSGLIVSINTLEGSAKVKTGQTVDAGDLLVSGVIDSDIVGIREVHAMAEVHARTWYNYTAVMPMKSVGKAYSGRTYTRYALTLGTFRLNFYRNSSQIYDNCDKITKHTRLRLSGNFALPVVWTAETFSEYTATPYNLGEQTADAYLKNVLGARLHGEIGKGEIVSVGFDTVPGDGVWACGMVAECFEPIAKTVLLPR